MNRTIEKIVENKAVIFFDGECLICNRLVEFIIKKDRSDLFLFSSLSNLNVANDTIVLYQNKTNYYRSQAVGRILFQLGGVWKYIAKVIQFMPISFADLIYNIVAKNRFRFFKKTDSCKLPKVENKHKFISLANLQDELLHNQ
ncbi:MAG: DCC1-like thiol-disulfide oxidoreductase family protein [Saprospiraceae bacterium]